MVGTYINGDKVQPNVPTLLESGNIIGIGCPENRSSKENGKETFVYKLLPPQKLVKHEDKTDNIQTLTPDTFKVIEAVLCLVIDAVVDTREDQPTVLEEDKNQYSYEGKNSSHS